MPRRKTNKMIRNNKADLIIVPSMKLTPIQLQPVHPSRSKPSGGVRSKPSARRRLTSVAVLARARAAAVDVATDALQAIVKAVTKRVDDGDLFRDPVNKEVDLFVDRLVFWKHRTIGIGGEPVAVPPHVF